MSEGSGRTFAASERSSASNIDATAMVPVSPLEVVLA